MLTILIMLVALLAIVLMIIDNTNMTKRLQFYNEQLSQALSEIKKLTYETGKLKLLPRRYNLATANYIIDSKTIRPDNLKLVTELGELLRSFDNFPFPDNKDYLLSFIEKKTETLTRLGEYAPSDAKEAIKEFLRMWYFKEIDHDQFIYICNLLAHSSREGVKELLEKEITAFKQEIKKSFEPYVEEEENHAVKDFRTARKL